MTLGIAVLLALAFGTYAFATGIQGSDLAAGAAVSLFLVPVLVLIAYFMLRLAHRAEVG